MIPAYLSTHCAFFALSLFLSYLPFELMIWDENCDSPNFLTYWTAWIFALVPIITNIASYMANPIPGIAGLCAGILIFVLGFITSSGPAFSIIFCITMAIVVFDLYLVFHNFVQRFADSFFDEGSILAFLICGFLVLVVKLCAISVSYKILFRAGGVITVIFSLCLIKFLPRINSNTAERRSIRELLSIYKNTITSNVLLMLIAISTGPLFLLPFGHFRILGAVVTLVDDDDTLSYVCYLALVFPFFFISPAVAYVTRKLSKKLLLLISASTIALMSVLFDVIGRPHIVGSIIMAFLLSTAIGFYLLVLLNYVHEINKHCSTLIMFMLTCHMVIGWVVVQTIDLATKSMGRMNRISVFTSFAVAGGLLTILTFFLKPPVTVVTTDNYGELNTLEKEN